MYVQLCAWLAAASSEHKHTHILHCWHYSLRENGKLIVKSQSAKSGITRVHNTTATTSALKPARRTSHGKTLSQTNPDFSTSSDLFPAEKHPWVCTMSVWKIFLLFFPSKNTPGCARRRCEKSSCCFSRQKTPLDVHDAGVKNLPVVFPAKKHPWVCMMSVWKIFLLFFPPKNTPGCAWCRCEKSSYCFSRQKTPLGVHDVGVKNLPVVFPAKKHPWMCTMSVWKIFLLFFPPINTSGCARCRCEKSSCCFSRQKWPSIHPRCPEIFPSPLIPIRIRITMTTRTTMKSPFYCNRIRKRSPWETPPHPIGRSRRLYFTSKTILMPRTLNAAGENGSFDGSFSPAFLRFYSSV